MRVGLVELFDGNPSRDPGYLREFAETAEAVGFDSLWFPEHLVFFNEHGSQYPYPPAPGSDREHKLRTGKDAGCYDPLFLCQAAAMWTRTLRVGTAISILPLRHPLVWAREVATVDHFSGGRLDFGVGVGWLKEEFDACNVPFAQRGRITDDYLGALRAAWAPGDSTYHGAYVRFENASCRPKPLQQPGPPVLIGGQSPAALRRVARFGDGWYGWNLMPVEVEGVLRNLDSELQTVDRSLSDVKIQVGWQHNGDLDWLARMTADYRRVGVQEMVIATPIRSDSCARRLAELAEAVDQGR